MSGGKKMKINIPFFYKRLPLIIERDSLYLGQVYNNDSKLPERKILCTDWFEGVKDVLFESPNYSTRSKKGYTVNQLVALGAFLEQLGYPSKLRAKDIKKIYHEVLSSTKTLHKYCEIFGVVRVREGHKGKHAYWPSANRPRIIGHEEFYHLEDLISLPIKPSIQEKQNERYSFQKRLFFIS